MHHCPHELLTLIHHTIQSDKLQCLLTWILCFTKHSLFCRQMVRVLQIEIVFQQSEWVADFTLAMRKLVPFKISLLQTFFVEATAILQAVFYVLQRTTKREGNREPANKIYAATSKLPHLYFSREKDLQVLGCQPFYQRISAIFFPYSIEKYSKREVGGMLQAQMETAFPLNVHTRKLGDISKNGLISQTSLKYIRLKFYGLVL